MARFARVLITGLPYHVTHRGNRGGEVFFTDADREDYLRDLAAYAAQYRLAIWGWCLMTNHIHLIAVPRAEDALAGAIGRAHMRHARRINRAQGWSGHLWANRFYSTPLDRPHLWTAIKYIELNPVRAGLAARAEEWPWSSARAHALGAPDPLLDPKRPFAAESPRDPLTGRPLAWAKWLEQGLEPDLAERLRRCTMTGRPCGGETFVRRAEARLGRVLTPQKPGRKAKGERNN